MEEFKNYEEAFEAMMVFVSNYFLVDKERPTVEEEQFARRLTKATLRLMMQLKELGMDEERDPMFFASFYIKDFGQNVGEVRYAFETIGGKLFEHFNLGLLGKELELAIASWYQKTFGEELTEKGIDALKAWGGALDD